jgi:hypothetical protein
MTIPDMLRKLVGQLPATIQVGTVTAVDGDTCTVLPQGGGAEVANVRLRPVLDEQTTGLQVVPAVNSLVLWCWLDTQQQDAAVLAVATPESATFETAAFTLALSNAGVLSLNGGSKGGVPVAADIATRLNNIETKLNQLITVFNTWAPIPSDGGAALKTALTAWVASTLTLTNAAQLENPDVKH